MRDMAILYYCLSRILPHLVATSTTTVNRFGRTMDFVPCERWTHDCLLAFTSETWCHRNIQMCIERVRQYSIQCWSQKQNPIWREKHKTSWFCACPLDNLLNYPNIRISNERYLFATHSTPLWFTYRMYRQRHRTHQVAHEQKRFCRCCIHAFFHWIQSMDIVPQTQNEMRLKLANCMSVRFHTKVESKKKVKREKKSSAVFFLSFQSIDFDKWENSMHSQSTHCTIHWNCLLYSQQASSRWRPYDLCCVHLSSTASD